MSHLCILTALFAYLQDVFYLNENGRIREVEEWEASAKTVKIRGTGWVLVQIMHFLPFATWAHGLTPFWVPERYVTAGPILGCSLASSHAAGSHDVVTLHDIGITRGVCVIHTERPLSKNLKVLFNDFTKEKADGMRADIENLKVGLACLCAHYPCNIHLSTLPTAGLSFP